MKKLMLLISVALISCRKTAPEIVVPETVTTEMKEGLPVNYNEISGYLTVATEQETGSQERSRIFANFSDPAKDMMLGYSHYDNYWHNSIYMGNINCGGISMCNMSIPSFENTSTFHYQKTLFNRPFNDSIFWTISGGDFLPALNLLPLRGLPVYKADSLPTKLYKSKGVTIWTVASLHRYDSAIVVLQITYNYKTLVKSTDKNGQIIISPTELTQASVPQTTGYYLNLYLINYSHITVNGRLLVLENIRRFYRHALLYN